MRDLLERQRVQHETSGDTAKAVLAALLILLLLAILIAKGEEELSRKGRRVGTAGAVGRLGKGLKTSTHHSNGLYLGSAGV